MRSIELRWMEMEKSSGWMKTPGSRLVHGVVPWVGHRLCGTGPGSSLLLRLEVGASVLGVAGLVVLQVEL